MPFASVSSFDFARRSNKSSRVLRCGSALVSGAGCGGVARPLRPCRYDGETEKDAERGREKAHAGIIVIPACAVNRWGVRRSRARA